MVNAIKASFLEDKQLIFDTAPEINEGEILSTKIAINIPQSFSDYNFYLEFSCPDGREFTTPKLSNIDNVVSYTFESCITKKSGQVYVQISCFDISGEMLFKSIKNNTASFKVNKSINSKTNTRNSIDFLSHAEELLMQNDIIAKLAEEKGAYALTEGNKAKSISELIIASKNNGEFNGYTPTIANNGNWIINNVDTLRQSKGDKGDTGSTGLRGEQGIKGEQGLKGDTGERGAQGTIGLTGIGLKGDTGDKGDKGEKGDKGDTGDKGDKGDTGLTGATGNGFKIEKFYVSIDEMNLDLNNLAYNINTYVMIRPTNTYDNDYGKVFNWSETQWVYSYNAGTAGLKGDKGDTGLKGDTGDTGLKGDKGDTGDKGEQGFIPTIGENDNWQINNVDTNKPSRGQKGDTGLKGDTGDTGLKGDKGDTGDKGEQGFIPTIGENDNWQINNVDTNKPSRGQKGDTGDTGSTGLKGDKGDIGLKGDTGLTGSAGAVGAKGDKGDTGAVGAKGDNGLSVITTSTVASGFTEGSAIVASGGHLSSKIIPTNTTQLTNDNGFISSVPQANATVLGGLKIKVAGTILYLSNSANL